MRINLIDSSKTFIVTENIDGLLYTIEVDLNTIQYRWNGSWEPKIANDSPVYCAIYNGKALDTKGKNFGELMSYIDQLHHEDTIKRYKKFQLQWMIDHGYSLNDLLKELSGFWVEDTTDCSLYQLYDLWEYERGFGGEIWPCFDEWKDCEGSEV